MATTTADLKAEKNVSVLSSVDTKGAFVRIPSTYRDWINKTTIADGDNTTIKFPAAKGRYILYISRACPWACRCLTVLFAKGLQKAIDVVVVHPIFMKTKPEVDNHVGWTFQDFEGEGGVEPVFGAKTIREIYERTCPADREPPTRFTVPILFDKERKLIVNNESSEIIQMFNSDFNEFAENKDLDLYPQELRGEIDRINDWLYESVSNGVYKCGFARSQEAYDEAADAMFQRLEEVDQLLDKQRYLVGDRITLADVRLVQTLVRWVDVYVVHFKCAKKDLMTYKNIPHYMNDAVQSLGMWKNGVINVKHIKTHYYKSHDTINPFGIIPQTPKVDFEAPHGRDTRKY